MQCKTCINMWGTADLKNINTKNLKMKKRQIKISETSETSEIFSEFSHFRVFDLALYQKSKPRVTKVANKKFGNLVNIIARFFFSDFLILPYIKNRKIGL